MYSRSRCIHPDLVGAPMLWHPPLPEWLCEQEIQVPSSITCITSLDHGLLAFGELCIMPPCPAMLADWGAASF